MFFSLSFHFIDGLLYNMYASSRAFSLYKERKSGKELLLFGSRGEGDPL